MYLNTYLTQWTFQVKHMQYLSDTKYPTLGLMQGSVLSSLLFVLAIDAQIKAMPSPIKIATYADDIAISATHKHAEDTHSPTNSA